MLITFTTMLFGKLDVPTAKDVLAHAGKESKVKVDFEILKKTVEEIELIEARSKPTPMDLGAVHNHICYVQAQDGSEGQEEWPEEDPNAWYEGCAQDEWPEDAEWPQLAAVRAAETAHHAHLAALKGKGKGKSKKGKGKGKGRKKSGKGGARNTQKPTEGETRSCYNCGEYGHLGVDCAWKDQRQAQPRLKEMRRS